MKKMMYREAICEALEEEMRRDPNVYLMGEDVGTIGGNFKVTVGLQDKFGERRVIDAPIAEAAQVGIGVGSALTGLRPVIELMFCDFIMVAMDQICNQMAKITYMSGGQCSVPMTIRMPMGGGRSSAAQHSQSFHAWLAHCPGMKVVVPSSAREAKGLLKTAIRDNNPVVFIEHKMLYTVSFDDVADSDEDLCIPFGKARLVTEGKDLTIVSCSNMVLAAERAVKKLESQGISADLIDLRTLVPLDADTILESVKKTGRLLIVDEGHLNFGITGEIAARVMKDAFYELEAPIERMGTENVPLPFSPVLEKPLIPNEQTIYDKILEMVPCV